METENNKINKEKKQKKEQAPVRDRAAHCAQCARAGKLTQQCWLINGTSSGRAAATAASFTTPQKLGK